MIRFFGDKSSRHHWGTAFGGFVSSAAVRGGSGDATAPTLSSATIPTGGGYIDLVYDESLDNTSTPATGDFAITVPSGSPPTISGISFQTTSVTNDTVRVSVSTNFYEPEADSYGSGVAVSYTVGANPIRDVATNNAAALVSQAVTNNSTVWPLSANGAAYSPEGGTLSGFMADRSPNGNDMVTASADPTLDASTYGAPVVDFAAGNYLTLPTGVCSTINGSEDSPAYSVLGLRIEDDTSQDIVFIGPSSVQYGLRLQTVNSGRVGILRRDAAFNFVFLYSAGSTHPLNTWTTFSGRVLGSTAETANGSSTTPDASGSLDVGVLSTGSAGTLGTTGAAGYDGQVGRFVIDSVDPSARDRAVLQRWVYDYTAAL